MSEPKEKLEAEIARVAARGGAVCDLSPAAYQYLYDYHVEDMPYGTAKARTGDPDEWLDNHALPDWTQR